MRKILSLIIAIAFSVMGYSQPNIIVIYLDDAPVYTDSLLIKNTPNINRIRDSGMNFINNYATISLCAPSRAVFMTGSYPCKTNVTDNSTPVNFNMVLPTFPHQLKQAGYYTAAVGKFHDVIGKHENYDWNYRLESVGKQDDDNIKFARNGKKPKKAGNDTLITKVIIDTAIALIHRIDEPLFLLLSCRFPHTPTLVPSPFDTMFESGTILFGDTVKYSNLFPSFLYNLPPKNYKTTAKMIPIMEDQYRSIAYADSLIGVLMNHIEPNTMIIFTSDNGFMNDEHGLYGKRHPYKESVEIPLYIWYNDWFQAGTSELLTSSVDLYATILHAAGVAYNGSQGYSIKDLYDGVATRQLAYYSMGYTAEEQNGGMASSKAVWDENFKLVSYGCNQVTEQFFDRKNDHNEINNLINTPQLQDTIQFYRSKLIQLRNEYGDTLNNTIINCSLITQ